MDDATTIDEVVERLDVVIGRAKATGSRLGYFSALYRRVTKEVKARITSGFFDDGPRMEHLDVIFANLYLHALQRYENGERPPEVWRFAFDTTRQWWPIVLQHLLLGMNAHINLDLGVAAVRAVGPSGLVSLRDDFNRINDVLADLVVGVERALAGIWPSYRITSGLLGDADDAIVHFSMNEARDAAWRFGSRLGTLDEEAQRSAIQRYDGEMLGLARLVRNPGVSVGAAVKLVRVGERGSVREIIELLE